MAKTYILEPTEVAFTSGAASADDMSEDVVNKIIAAMQNENIEDSTLSIGEEIYYYASSQGGSTTFTKDGEIAEYGEYVAIWNDIGNIDINDSDLTGNVTISIYTGEDDPEPTPGGLPGLEDKNVVYEYQLVANNNIKDILLAVMDKNGANAVNIPGYSVMQLLVENLLVFHNIGGRELTTFRATTFANDAEKIAWIIRNASDEPMS